MAEQYFFDSPSHEHFPKIYSQLHDLCLKKQVSHSLHFNEGSGQWYVTITSSAVSENYVTGDGLLCWVLYTAIDWVSKL